MSDMEKKIEEIEIQLGEIRATLDFVKDTITKADTTITTIGAQIMPFVNELAGSPIMKMLGMKK